MANLVYPERNRELSKVSAFWDVEQNGILHNGITIQANCDPRDYMAGRFKARLNPAKPNEVLIELPSMRHSDLHEAEKFKERKTAFGINCTRLQEAEDVARNKILTDPDRQKLDIVLRFPDDMKLTNKHYSPDSQEEDDNIDDELVFIETVWEVPNTGPVKKHNMIEAKVEWKVSIIEAEPRRVATKDTAAKLRAAKVALRLEGMNIGTA